MGGTWSLVGCCGGGIDWGRGVNSWNETAGWLQALPRGKMLALGWEHWDALVGAFQGKSSHEQPFGASRMACGSGDLLFWGHQCPETLHRMRPHSPVYPLSFGMRLPRLQEKSFPLHVMELQLQGSAGQGRASSSFGL